MLVGIDFSFGNGLNTSQIKATSVSVNGAVYHLTFVARYLSGGLPKDITAPELSNYKAAGIPVVFVFETTGTDMTSFANGVADATTAQTELNTLSKALKDTSIASAVVFFAADAAAETDESDYLKGAISVIGLARTGIYGGYNSVKAAFDNKLATYGWQTFAWSNGQWDDRALLRQGNQINVGPATCDLDEAAFWNSTKILGPGDDFGQWPTPGGPKWPVINITSTRRSAVAEQIIWEKVPGAEVYQYQAVNKTTGAVLVADGLVESPSAILQTLPVGTKVAYRWAVGADSKHRASDWSPWHEFTIE